MKILFKCCLLLLAPIQADVAINAQQPCRPPAPQLSREPNIFTEEQEVELGETVAEHIQRKFRVIGDDEVFVAEDVTDELELYATDKNQLLAAVALPQTPLGRLRAMAVSPDFKCSAVSKRSRSAVWNLARGEGYVFLRGFCGGFFSEEGMVYVVFPKGGEAGRQIASLDTNKLAIANGQEIKEGRTA